MIDGYLPLQILSREGAPYISTYLDTSTRQGPAYLSPYLRSRELAHSLST